MLTNALVEDVVTLLETELSLYKKIQKLVALEEEAVKDSNMEWLLQILEDKQAVISEQELLLDSWGTLSALLGVANGRENQLLWSVIERQAGADGYEEIVSRVQSIRELAKGVIDHEESVRAALENNIQEMRKQLKVIGTGRSALAGYAKHGAI